MSDGYACQIQEGVSKATVKVLQFLIMPLINNKSSPLGRLLTLNPGRQDFEQLTFPYPKPVKQAYRAGKPYLIR